MKLPIDTVYLVNNTNFGGGDFAKSVSTDAAKGVAVWYTDQGVLVEKRGQPNRLVPMSAVSVMESKEGFGVAAAKAAIAAEIKAVHAEVAEHMQSITRHVAHKETVRPAGLLASVHAVEVEAAPVAEAPKKRGPGRPVK